MMFDILEKEQEKAYNFVKKNHENGSFSHAYILEVKNYSNFDLFLKYLISCILDDNIVDIYNNADIFIVRPDNGTIKKNQIDDLQKNFFTKSVVSKRKIYIIYGADKMNDVSSNSLLKFIEEPEENIFAILITENRFALLKTILSRCQVLKLKSNFLNKNDDDIFNVIYYVNNSARNFDEKDYEYVKDITNKVLLFIDCYEKTGINSLIKTNIFFGKMVKGDIELFLDILTLFYYDVIRIFCSFESNVFNDKELLEFVKNNNNIENVTYKIKSTILIKNKLRYNINGNLLIEKLILLFERRCCS